MKDFFENVLGIEFTVRYIVAQIIGFVAMGIMAVSFQQKEQKKIMLCQCCAGMLFAVSFFIQVRYTGMILNLVGSCRAFVYSNCKDKKWANSIVFPICFVIMFILSTVFTWEAWFSFLPMVAQIASTLAYRSTNAMLVRGVSLPCSLCWMAYNVLIGNVSGLATEIMCSSSIIIGFFRHDLHLIKASRKDMNT